jgi:hypothetical protein
MSDISYSSGAEPANEVFTPQVEHAETVDRAIRAIQRLLIDHPDMADVFRSATTTEEVRVALRDRGIEISNEVLWRHRGVLMEDGQPTWRG